MGADTAAKAMEEHHLLACSPGFSQSAFLYNPGSPAQGWHCPEQAGLPISIIDQDYIIDLPTGQFGGGIFSVEVPSSQMDLAWVKLQEN